MAQDDLPPCELPRFWASSPIPVIVDKGAKQEKFFVHEDLLMYASEYFRTALFSNFEEGKTKICRLEEDNACAFDLFVQYLYTNDYDVTVAVPFAEGGTGSAYHQMHAAAYALGNKIMAPRFQRLVLCKMALAVGPKRDIDMTLLLDMATTIYAGTTSGDGDDMRTLMAKYCASRFPKPEEELDEDTDTETTKKREELEELWSKEEIAALVDSQLNDFIIDVLSEVRGAAPFSHWLFTENLYVWGVVRCWKFRG